MDQSPIEPNPSRPPAAAGAGGLRGAESLATSLGSTVSEHGAAPLAPDSTEETISTAPGQLGRYRLDSILGKGGFGEVWLAFDPVLHRQVAVKFPRADRQYPREHAETLLDEARRVANLKIPGVTPVFDVGVEDGRVFVVYQYLDGGTLAEQMSRRKFSHAEAAALMAEIAETLHQAHLNNLVHRDIKPANILFDAKGRPFVADFGLATSEREQLREQNNTLGTYAYMSPEQAAGESRRVDGRTDVYSAGVILFELLTGRLPYMAESVSEYLEQVIHREPRPLRSIDDAIPPALERICLKSLAKRASERYTTAGDMAAELRAWRKPAPTRHSLTVVRLLILAAALAVVLLLAVGINSGTSQLRKTRQQREPSGRVGILKTEQPGHQPEANVQVPPAAPAAAAKPPAWPRELLYPGHKTGSTYGFVDATKTHLLTSDAMQLVQLGELIKPEQIIRVDLQQIKWGNCAGVFLGYREESVDGARSAVFQAFFLREDVTSRDPRKLRVRRWQASLNPETRTLSPVRQLGEAVVNAPLDTAPREFEIRLGLHCVASVRWDGRELLELVKPNLNDKLLPADFLGAWGILNENGTTAVRVLQPTDSGASNP